MRRPFTVLIIVALGAALVATLGSYSPTGEPQLAVVKGTTKKGPAGKGGVPVETAPVRIASAASEIPSVGSLKSDESVQLAPEVTGRVAEILFREGDTVQAGDVILKLDDALARAELADAQARFSLAKANIDRATTLSRSGNIAERVHDEARANFESAQATLELARVRLAKHTIRAPFAGSVGLRNLSVGAFVAPGTAIVNLEKIDVLKVDFRIPERFLARIRTGQIVAVNVDALPRHTFRGEIYAIDPQVDVNGRSLHVRARLPNPDLLLRPGLFARIVVRDADAREVAMIPESAVVPRGGETYVFYVENGRAVEAKVELGLRRAGEVEVLSGLPHKATVVTAGHQRLRNGASVEVILSGTEAGARAGG